MAVDSIDPLLRRRLLFTDDYDRRELKGGKIRTARAVAAVAARIETAQSAPGIRSVGGAA